MVNTLSQAPKLVGNAFGKPGEPDFHPVAALMRGPKPLLSAFITDRSWLFFDLIAANTDWMTEEPCRWPLNEDYIYQRDFCRDIQVVNDAAERAVKDVQDYAKVTRDPVLRDTVILVANDHRGRITNLRKNQLNDM